MLRVPALPQHERDCVEAAVYLMLLSKSPSPETVKKAGADDEAQTTPTASPRKRRGSTSRDAPPALDVRKRLCTDFSDDNVLRMPTPTSASSSGLHGADFMIHGIQGALAVCERRVIVRDGEAHPYMLVRLRGQSNTLPHDARLSVTFDGPQPDRFIDIYIARIRIKAGALKYDFLPNTCRLPVGADGRAFEAPLLSSIFSKKCWAGVVVRGPRMFVAFTRVNGKLECHSAPMFVEISPTSNSPSYRDPVLEYPNDLVNSFFSKSTFAKLGRMYNQQQQN